MHLTMADVQVDSSTNPQSFRVFIKCSKTDPFCKGCFIFLGRGSFPLCPVVSLTNYLHLCGPGTSPLFIYQNGTPLSRSQLSSFLQTTLQQQLSLESSPAIVLRLELQLLPPGRVFLTISLRLWGAGLVKLTCYMCVLQWKSSFLLQDDLRSRYKVLYPSFGLFFWVPSDLEVSLWGSGFPGHEAPFSPSIALPVRRSSGLAWGLMPGLRGFASYGSGLHLGAGCQ